MSEMYEILYTNPLEEFPQFTHRLVGFLEQFVNVTIMNPYEYSWFGEFQYVYGEQFYICNATTTKLIITITTTRITIITTTTTTTTTI